MKNVSTDTLINTIANNHGIMLPAKGSKTVARKLREGREDDQQADANAGDALAQSQDVIVSDQADAPLQLAQANTAISTPAGAGEVAQTGAVATEAGVAASTSTGFTGVMLGGVALGGLALASGGSKSGSAAIDTTAPTFTSATTNAAGTTITLTYSEALSATTAATGAFAVMTGGSANVVTTVTVSGSTVVLTLTTAVTNGQAVTVAYTDPTAGNDTNAVQDTAGNDAVTLAATAVTNVTNITQYDLGSSGKLIAPVQVEGKWYYFWDRSGDGTSNNTGSLNGGVDFTTHDVLDGIFNKDINGVTNTTVANADGNFGTTDIYRYATINGVKLALPTANGGMAFPQGIGAYQNGTVATGTGTANNSSFDELLAIWDTHNGTGTGTGMDGTPSAWQASTYWSATPSASGHASVFLEGYVNNDRDDGLIYVALQVL